MVVERSSVGGRVGVSSFEPPAEARVLVPVDLPPLPGVLMPRAA